jgi:GTPase SAR1 family protein
MLYACVIRVFVIRNSNVNSLVYEIIIIISNMKFDEKIQLIIVGESSVGKTSLLYK